MRLIIVCVLMCCAAGTLCASSPCHTKSMPELIRVKRAKYYSSPPQRFYKRPPMSYQNHGAFSYTPPPSHMMDDDDQPNHRPHKYNRRPTTEGLGDEDINNLLKYLSKKDLDKIVEHTLAKDKFKKGYDKPLDFPKPVYNEATGSNEAFDDGNKFSLNGPFIKANGDYAPTENPSYNENYAESRPIVVPDTQQMAGNLHFYSPTNEETTSNQQFAVVDGYMQQAINGLGSQSGLNIFTDGKVMQEEQLPMPSNLRYEDHYASFTNNDPAVVKANSYRVENFGSLPLMNFDDSKLHTVSSYNVPHYTVTTPNQNQPTVPQQPQPQPSPASTRQSTVDVASSQETKYPDQSDAHLKATKIWTHKSTGTAYYLHKDGTLSLERPRFPKFG